MCSIALGLATPAAAAGLTGVMLTALRTAIWKDGIKPATGEFEVLLATAALALAETGPAGRRWTRRSGSSAAARAGRSSRSAPARPGRRSCSRAPSRRPADADGASAG